MSIEHAHEGDPRVQQALGELEGLIRQRYPTATFRVSHGEDPDGLYLKATVDIEDTDEVADVFMERLLQLQIDEDLPVYVVPLRPPKRVAQTLRSRLVGRRPLRGRAALDEEGHQLRPPV